MSKNKVVVFGKQGARILINPDSIDFLLKYNNVMVNPDLSKVDGIPPEHWKMENGNVVPMLDGEKPTEASLQQKIIVAEKHIPGPAVEVEKIVIQKVLDKKKVVLISALFSAIAAVIVHYTHL